MKLENLESIFDVPMDVKFLLMLRIGWREHLEELRAGKLRFSSIQMYKDHEGSPKVFHDENEGIESIFRGDKVKLVIGPPGRQFDISAEQGLVDVRIAPIANYRVLCFHMIHTGVWTHLEFGEDRKGEFLAALQIPEKMNEYGDHVFLVRDIPKFYERISVAVARERLHLTGKMVRYVDFSNAHGTLSSANIGFMKDIKFADEREFRLRISAADRELSHPFCLEVGDLSDVANIMSLKSFRDTFRIEFPDEE